MGAFSMETLAILEEDRFFKKDYDNPLQHPSVLEKTSFAEHWNDLLDSYKATNCPNALNVLETELYRLITTISTHSKNAELEISRMNQRKLALEQSCSLDFYHIAKSKYNTTHKLYEQARNLHHLSWEKFSAYKVNIEKDLYLSNVDDLLADLKEILENYLLSIEAYASFFETVNCFYNDSQDLKLAYLDIDKLYKDYLHFKFTRHHN